MNDVCISMVIIAKNEAGCITQCIASAKPYVNEILVVDDHSTDDTASLATLMGARVLSLPWHVHERGFAESSNWMISQATHDWILFIDADELLGNPERLHTLMRYPGKEVWALPRRKWFEYPVTRMEIEAYPDWQIRFFKRNGVNKFDGHMHIRYQCPKIYYAYRGPHIEHLQTEHRDANKLDHRADLYPKLAKIQGVEVHGGDVVRVIKE